MNCLAVPKMLISNTSTDSLPMVYIANCNKKDLNLQEFQSYPIIHAQLESILNEEIIDWLYVGKPDLSPLHPYFSPMKEYISFIEQYKHLDLIYAMGAEIKEQGIKRLTKVVVLDAKSGKEIRSFQLPSGYEEGHLTLGRIYYDNAWRSVLVVTLSACKEIEKPIEPIHDEDEIKFDSVLIFDLTDHKQPFAPKKILKLDAFSLNSKTPPQIWRLKDNHWYLALAVNPLLSPQLKDNLTENKDEIGKEIRKDHMALFSFEDFNHTIILKQTNTESTSDLHKIISATPIDTLTKGIVDRIYVSYNCGKVVVFNMDDLCLDKKCSRLKNSLEGTYHGNLTSNPTKMREIKTSAIGMKDPNEPGILLFYNVEEHQNNQLKIIKDNLIENDKNHINNDSNANERLKKIEKKLNLLNPSFIFLRNGRLFILENDIAAKPQVFAWSNDEWKKIDRQWQQIGRPDIKNTKLSMKLIDARWYRDLKNKSDILVTLNDGCQLNFLTTPIIDPNKPLMWRKIKY